ncbi:MAG: SDR family oxidoreductase [bacterium]
MSDAFNSLVTGGLQGIGNSIALALKERGDNVFIFDVLPLDHALVLEVKEQGFYYFNVNVSSLESVQKGFINLFNQLQNFSNQNLNLLVNNAGITKDNLLIRMSEKDWDDVLDVNLKGTFFCCQQAIKKMMHRDNSYLDKSYLGKSYLDKSYIISISSIVGITGNAGQANYAASKAGLIALTKSLAMEYGARNILINAIAPGFIKTDMTEKLPEKIKENILQRISLKKFGLPQDVANLILFLSSGKADYITGQVLGLDGGLF